LLVRNERKTFRKKNGKNEVIYQSKILEHPVHPAPTCPILPGSFSEKVPK
jgi:hypothetical protein